MISPHAVYPDWALLTKTARFSDERNETTAECHTPEGQPVAVSFWLSDPPAVSHFTVHCPGLTLSDTPPHVICAEGAFVLFRVTLVDRSLHHHFVYSAGENPSLHLIPNPDTNIAPSFRNQQKFGLLPRGDEHYAVAFLDWEWPRDSLGKTHYHACVFSSVTNAWTRSKAAPLRLPESDKALFETYAHGSHKQITVGWVDLTCGILLACNLFDETPVMRFIPFPSSRAHITYKDDADAYYSTYSRDVVCSGDLIRLVETDFKESDSRTNGQGRRATTWNMKLDWDYWRKRCTVDVDDVSVDQRYSVMLPELVDEETRQLKLKKLDSICPTLGVPNDNLLYMIAKVDQRDDTACWVVVVDMRRAAVETLVPVSTEPDTGTMYCSCAFPGYYPGDDTVKTDDGSQDALTMEGYRYWGQDWCEQSLVSWDFSKEEDEHEEDPVKNEDGDVEEDLPKKEENDEDDDEEEDPVIRAEEECQAVNTIFCHETDAGVVTQRSESHEIWQGGVNPDGSEHQQNKKKRRRKRTRSSRRRKKQVQAQIPDVEIDWLDLAQVPDLKTYLLDLLHILCCILIWIIIRASIMAFPGYNSTT